MTEFASPVADDELCLQLALRYEEPLAFCDYVISTVIALQSHAVPLESAIERFTRLRERHPYGTPLIDQALNQLSSGAAWRNWVSDPPLPVVAVPFFEALLGGEPDRAARIVRKLRFSGMPLEEIYLMVLEPAQREIGRRWELGMLDVAREHAFTQGVVEILREIGPSLESQPSSDRILVAATPEGETHTVGISMVADIYRLREWNVHLVGGDVPIPDLLDFTEALQPHVLAISISLLRNLEAAPRIRRELDRRPALAGTRFIVGGRLFNVAPGLWEKTGADGFAANARRVYYAANE